MRYLKNISLIIAGSLLLLHTLVPHDHHSELDELAHIEKHQQATGLFEYLQLAFHIDLGGEHLENFKTASYFFIHPGSIDSKLFDQTYQLVLSEASPIHPILYSSCQEIQNLSFRGPPAFA